MRHGTRVLLYEPDRSLRDMLVRSLDSEGCVVEPYDSPTLAASFSCSGDETGPTIFLCAVAGAGDLEQLRPYPKPEIPMIAMTPPGGRNEVAESGLCFVLERPFRFSQLRVLLKAALEQIEEREWAKGALGETVLGAIEVAAGDERQVGSAYTELIQAACSAFPHTSIYELAASMVGGIDERGERR
jgi:DNA-binding response OmpR family regulator